MDVTPELMWTSASTAVIVSEVIEIAKKLKWIPIDWTTEGVNRFVGAIAAFLTGLGLQFHFDAATGQLVVTGLFFSSIAQGVIQWATQQAYYRIVVKSKSPITVINNQSPPVTASAEEILKALDSSTGGCR